MSNFVAPSHLSARVALAGAGATAPTFFLVQFDGTSKFSLLTPVGSIRLP